MSRMSKYTALCLLLAAVFVIGSMTGMNAVLQMRERQRLKESGTVAAKSPVLAWQASSAEEETAGEEEAAGLPVEKEERSLTVEQMEEVIRYRAHCEGEILHEPAAGQITMEEAIAVGEDWLGEMGFLARAKEESETAEETGAGTECEIVIDESGTGILPRRASLGVKADLNRLEVPMESWYSFWTVRFSNKNLYASLSVNAVTGKVWDAEVDLYKDTGYRHSLEKLKLFIRLAGVEEETEQFAQTNESGSWVSIAVKGSRLYAQQGYYATVVSTRNDFVEYAGKDEEELRYSQSMIDYHLRVEE